MSDIDNPQRTYLGDGAYADFLGYAVRIWCDRENGEHEVFLEPDMLERLIEFAQSRGWKAGHEARAVIERLETDIVRLRAENEAYKQCIRDMVKRAQATIWPLSPVQAIGRGEP